VLRAARWKCITPKKSPKIPVVHHRTNLSSYTFVTKACIDNRKKSLLNSNMSSTFPHNMVNFGPLMVEISSGVWGTAANFNGFHDLPSLLQRHRSPEANRTLHNVWPSPGLVHYIYIFGGCCPLSEFCPVQKLRPSLVFSYIGSVTARHSSSGCQTNLRHGTRNGITELSHRAPPIFSRAAITLGIGPRSSHALFWIVLSAGARAVRIRLIHF